MTKSLTLKQALLVKAYLGEARGNGVKAARFAGYRGNEATLRAIASENLTKPNIAAEVSRRVSKILEPDEVLTELCMIAEAQITERIKTTEKLKALELVRRHHKLFEPQLKITVEQMDRQIDEACRKHGLPLPESRQLPKPKND